MRLTAVRLLAGAAVALTAASSAFGAGSPASARLLSPPNNVSGAAVTLKARVAAGKKKAAPGRRQGCPFGRPQARRDGSRLRVGALSPRRVQVFTDLPHDASGAIV